jgi:hypothetical protein
VRMAWVRIAIALAFAVAGSVLALSAPPGRIALQVFDAGGACVPAAAIELRPLASTTRTTVVADGQGRAEFELAPGAERPHESPLNIRSAHNSAPELATKAQLEHLVAANDLRQWTFTHEIVIDEKSIPHSHPVLTLHTRHLKQDDELLSTYLHEQLHWFLERRPNETKAAEQDLMKLYPNVPVGYPEGANDTESTYLHLLVCRLEQQADRTVLGDERTAEVMQFWAGDHYRWVYRTVLADAPKIDEILKRHGLAGPDARDSRGQRPK